jgi:hypothetical protein
LSAAGRVSFSLVIHNHQPVGNFGWVIEDVYEHAYRPMIEALERHPGIRLGLHYTGPLLQWLVANQPQTVERIRALVERGQVEIVGGGFYEPILVTLPDRDRHGQLVRMADELEKLFGRRPPGAWLAERVWEPSLPSDLAAAGYAWTIVDDNHLRAASIPEDDMWTSFTTDDRGRRLTVFGTEMGLRYLIPFKPVDELMAYLARRVTPDGRFLGFMGDDGEKFGAWPGTYEYCWTRDRWVDRLFEAVEGAEWLTMLTPSDWLAGHPPTTRVYIPDASYTEMTEWVLPPDEAPVFVELLTEAQDKKLPARRFLRGGFWRNFAVRYREINDLHKQMLRASAKVAAMAEAAPGIPGTKAGSGAARARALDHLYQGQSNDCYWHGLFGGIYIPHMRMATLAHLIAAEDLADAAEAAAGGQPYGARLVDTDLDALDEILVATPSQTLVIEPAEGANLSAWDLRASRMALASVMRRRREAYHAQLIDHEQSAAARSPGLPEGVAVDEGTAGDDSGAPKTIHDIFSVKEPGLVELLHYDRYERRNGIALLLPPGSDYSLEQLATGDWEDLGDFAEEPFEVASLADDRMTLRRSGALRASGAVRRGSSVRADTRTRPLVVEKTFAVGGNRRVPTLELTVRLENTGPTDVAFDLAIEWNVNLLGGGHNAAAFYELPDRTREPHDGRGDLPSAARLTFGNEHEGVKIGATFEPAARLTWYPVETVSNSEAGFERVYQGSSLLARWPVSLASGESTTRKIGFRAVQSVDRSSEESR